MPGLKRSEENEGPPPALQASRAEQGSSAPCFPTATTAAPVCCVRQISTFTTPQINLPDSNPETRRFSVEQKLQVNHFSANSEDTPALKIGDKRERCSAPAKGGGGLRDFPRKARPFLRLGFVLCPHSEDEGGTGDPLSL